MDGDKRRESWVLSSEQDSGVLRIALRGLIGHREAQQLLGLLAAGLASEARVLLLDLTAVEAIEPGVPGRVVSRCAAGRLVYSETVIVTRSTGYAALARAASVVFKHGRVHVVPTMADAVALLGDARGARGRRSPRAAISGEHPRADAAVSVRAGASRRSMG
jgi:hypothetical protein